MNLFDEIVSAHAEMIEIRRDLHRHPELAYEEHRTADVVAERLGACGIPVTRGLGHRGGRDLEVWARQPGNRTARGHGCARNGRDEHLRVRIPASRPDARLRARRTYHDAPRRGPPSRRARGVRRHRPLHLPAGGRRCGRRRRDDPGRAVRTVPGRVGMGDAQFPDRTGREVHHPRRSLPGQCGHGAGEGERGRRPWRDVPSRTQPGQRRLRDHRRPERLPRPGDRRPARDHLHGGPHPRRRRDQRHPRFGRVRRHGPFVHRLGAGSVRRGPAPHRRRDLRRARYRRGRRVRKELPATPEQRGGDGGRGPGGGQGGGGGERR